jgi:hypothetical protein
MAALLQLRLAYLRRVRAGILRRAPRHPERAIVAGEIRAVASKLRLAQRVPSPGVNR